MADILNDRGIKEVAVTYTNNDYGKGLADSFEEAFTESGGTVTMNASHEDGKADYSAEVGALASAGGEVLVVAGYIDQGGAGIIKGALDSGAFDTFMFPDGMVSETLEKNFGLGDRRLLRAASQRIGRRPGQVRRDGQGGRVRSDRRLRTRKL